MRHGSAQQARDALEALSSDEVQQVLGLLCSSRPEAVLSAVDDLRRHRAVVAQLRADRRPPAPAVTDHRGQVAALGGYEPLNP